MNRISTGVIALPAAQHGTPARPSRWDGLTIVLAGVILQYVWRVQEVFPALARLEFTTIVSVGAVLLFIMNGNPARRVAHLSHPLYRLVLGIFVIAALSVPTSLHDGDSFRFLTGNLVKTVVLAGVLAASIRDRQDVERLLRVLVLGGAGYVIASVVLSAPVAGARLGGKGSYDPNDLGLLTVSTIPICIYLMRGSARLADRAIGIAGAAVLLVGTVQSGSRGGFLALVAVAAYGVLGLQAVRQSKRIAALVAGAAVMIGVGGDKYVDRIASILTPQQDYNWAGQAESGRIEIWKRGLGYMIRRPVLGVGIQAFNVAEGTLAARSFESRRMGIGFKWSTAHSSYVQIGAELGIPGLLLFVALLIRAFREARKIGRTAATPEDRFLGQAFAATLVGFAVGGAFLSQAYSTYLYLLLGILIGLARVTGIRPLAVPELPPTIELDPRNTGARYRIVAGGRRSLA